MELFDTCPLNCFLGAASELLAPPKVLTDPLLVVVPDAKVSGVVVQASLLGHLSEFLGDREF